MRAIALALVAVAVAAGLATAIARRPRLPAAERGRRLAERVGCFGCHGPGGLKGANNADRVDGTVPNFADDVMMYAKTPLEIHEWIHFGQTRAKAASATWRADRDRGALRMPAYKDRLNEREMDDLVAFVEATSGMDDPADSTALHGLERAQALGCTGCHGPGGRLARPNPGSWKGVVPSWDGGDFPEIVKDRAEFGEWVERGVSRRFEANPAARAFLERAVVRMPAFKDHLKDGDVDALWAYVTWLRSSPRAATAVEDAHD